MEYLHTMVRVADLDQSLDFYCNKLGLVETRRTDNEKGRYTLVFLATPRRRRQGARGSGRRRSSSSPTIGTSTIIPGGRNFGHLAYRVDDIYGLCQKLMDAGVTINRPPRDGYMAFVRSPDGISIELLQRGEAKPPQEPWASMQNTGAW